MCQFHIFTYYPSLHLMRISYCRALSTDLIYYFMNTYSWLTMLLYYLLGIINYLSLQIAPKLGPGGGGGGGTSI